MESLDEMLVTSWYNVHSCVPQSYVQPPEERPGRVINSLDKAIPLIDLRGQDRVHITKQILKASQDYGFFQVINHGISKDLMNDAVKVFKEFHGMPAKEKVNECSKDPNGSCRLYTSTQKYKEDAVHYWKDSLTHPCPPSGEFMEYWPQKPSNYREVVGEYTRELKKLALEILELLCEELGLSSGYFSDELSENPELLVHHYPPCPDPCLTLGLRKHRDPTIITILLQDEGVQGLQILKDGEWIGVQPIPNAFVVNIGLLMQVITNGRLVGAEHRTVTNSSTARTSAAYFIYPSFESIIEPAQSLINASTDSPIYKSMPYGEFRRNFLLKGPKFEEDLKFL